MRIVFMGTPGFAIPPLERLYNEGHDIAAVVTRPDRPRNRGMKVSCCPVKEYAISRGTLVHSPETLRDGVLTDILRELTCELIVVVAFGKLLPVEMLRVPSFGCVNLHGSLLPKYRGASPIQWAVLNGETETGVTAMYMAEELDAGDILGSKKTHIGDDETTGEVYARLMALGADLIIETIDAVSRGTVVRVPQNVDEVTYAHPMTKSMSPIDWTRGAHGIKCQVRGLNPWPVASTVLNGNTYKIYTVDIGRKEYVQAPGSIVSAGKQGIEIACSDGSVIIRELQAPGGKRMPAEEFLRGHSI